MEFLLNFTCTYFCVGCEALAERNVKAILIQKPLELQTGIRLATLPSDCGQ